MTLDQIRTFLAVARLGGIRRAAEEMNLTQPAVSSRIAGIEEYFGTRLFQRESRGMTLTKAGSLLLGYAEQMITIAEDMRRDVMAPEAVSSYLRIGVAETIAQSWLPQFLRELHRQYPKLRIEISVDVSVNLRSHLLDRSLDLAILMGPLSDYSIDNIELPPIVLGWFCPPGFERQELGTMPIITYNRNSRPYKELARELDVRLGQRANTFSTNSLSTGFEMIAAGIGVGILPEKLGRRLVEEKRISKFDPGWLPSPLIFTASFIGTPRDATVSEAAKIAQSVAWSFDAESQQQTMLTQ